MKCHEVVELITPAVDERLDPSLRKEFVEHTEVCTSCRSLYELEALTKNVVRRHMARHAAPAALREQLITDLGLLGRSENPQSWLARVFSGPKLRPALAFGAAAALAWILFASLPFGSHHSHTAPDDNDIIHLSLNNFDAILAGRLQPQVTSNDRDQVQEFFSRTVGYNVTVPRLHQCTLIGGLVSKYGDHSHAHLVYKYGNDVIYLYQVDLREVLDGRSLTLPPHVLEELLRTGSYAKSYGKSCSMVMWVAGNTLCTAVADIEKEKLIQYLPYYRE